MFLSSKKSAQQTAQRMIAGHVSLVAWWTLRHAGVLDAIVRQEAANGEALNAVVHALRTNMSAEVLRALLTYLDAAGLVSFAGDAAKLTPEGRALFEQEDGVLELLRAYEPVLNMSEHLLAKLKTYGPPNAAGAASGGGGGGGVYKKSEYLLDSQAQRFAAELFPAITAALKDHHFSHLLDISCGTGDLLIHIANALKSTVAVGIGPDPASVRRANDAITAADLEKRLIAVPGNPLDVCTDTSRAFDRIGISRQLWAEMDCILALQVFSETVGNVADPAGALAKTLAATRKNFPTAHLLIAETTATPRFDKNYYAPEYALMLRLSKSTPWPPEQWREALQTAKYSVLSEIGLTTEGLTLFLAKPHPTPKAPPASGR